MVSDFDVLPWPLSYFVPTGALFEISSQLGFEISLYVHQSCTGLLLKASTWFEILWFEITLYFPGELLNNFEKHSTLNRDCAPLVSPRFVKLRRCVILLTLRLICLP